MEAEKNSAYSVEQLVAIGDHIHNCSTSFIIAAKNEPDDIKNMLTCMTGKGDDRVRMLFEAMKNYPEIAGVVENAFLTYQLHVNNAKTSN